MFAAAFGMLTTDRLWFVEQGSNPLISGGAYGLEASLPGLAVTVVAAGVTLAWFMSRRRGLA